MILLLNMMTIDVASFLDPATLEISVIIRNEKGEDMAALSTQSVPQQLIAMRLNC